MAVSKKVCVIGDFSVGKTSLVRRYVLGEFSDEYKATLGVDIYKFSDRIDVPGAGQQEINLIIWDVEGRPEKTSLLDTYLRGASGTLVIGDITRENAVESLHEHAEHFHRIVPGRPVVFALNKADLLNGGKTPVDAGNLERSYDTVVMRTSAKSGTEVPELFRALAERIIKLGV